ncbi:MBL fold metallo-hydrolase [Salinisphaera sp. USBA-960]|nr:MBL fold metallo-hydrolase [Salifodinibacter halophilus]NNC27089.1 MBL fold metallo-hydrolase [Salifodinibacter halophilus]
MRFAVLGSGSSGNALVVENANTRVLIDAGFSARTLERRLAELERDFNAFDAIVITHEHSDHWQGVSRLSHRYQLPVWLTPGTHFATHDDPVFARELYSPHEPFSIGDLAFNPYPIPHDAREPAQLIISNGDSRLGILTDAGHATPHIRSMIDGCHGLIVEANHDADLLASGPYPATLKKRVASGHGHLGNHQARELVAALNTDALQHVVAAHISQSNNHTNLAREALADALNCTPDWVQVADQRAGLGWRSLGQ